jgi:hypothetical protein
MPESHTSFLLILTFEGVKKKCGPLLVYSYFSGECRPIRVITENISESTKNST